MARQALAVWIYGVRVALLERARAEMRLTYTREALDRFPLNTPLLSVAMPLAATPYRIARDDCHGDWNYVISPNP